MRFKSRVTKNTASTSIIRLQLNLKNLPNEAYQEWRRNTPRASGNARDKTRLEGDTIAANYDYAQRLDKGYSKKSPRGMLKPTLAYIERLIREYIKK